MASFYIQHKDQVLLSISGARQNADDIVIDESLANDFYSAKESLSNWIIIDNEIVKDDLGVGVSTGKLKEIKFVDSVPTRPSFIIVPDYNKQSLDLYYPIEHQSELKNKRTIIYINATPYVINFNLFDNGHLHLLVSINEADTIKTDDLIRNVVLLKEYFPSHLKSKEEKIVYLKCVGNEILLPVQFENKVIYLTDRYNPNIIKKKVISTNKISNFKEYKIMVDGYELRST